MIRPLLLLLLVLAGCAPAVGRPTLPASADIPRLQALVLRDSADLPARVSLALAYRSSGRLDDARAVLESLVAERPDDPGPVLLLGLAQEEGGDWSGARRSYQRYLAMPGAAELRTSLQNRLRHVQRQELEAEVRTSLRQEAERTALAPDPNRVAVFPFVLQTADTTLRPLSRALAELLVTDLAMTQRLHVLERAQVQLLLDEIALGQTGVIDPATAARGGRLLRAGRIVQGSIEGDAQRLRLPTLLLAAGRDSLSRIAPLVEEDAIDQLFGMEKRLALSLYGSLGIQLTPAERERVLQRPTQSLQALLAFGRALEAEDRGAWAEAARHYERALALDPQFGLASAGAQGAGAIADAQQTTVEVVIAQGVAGQAIVLLPALPHPAVSALRSTPLTLGLGQTASSVLVPDPIRGILPDPLQRDPGAEVLGREGLASSTILRIVFRRPANEP